MDGVELLETMGRICKSTGCGNCVIRKACGQNALCSALVMAYAAKEVVLAVEEWAKAHPVKTRAMAFFERFPNAPKTSTGLPTCCTKNCGYIGACATHTSTCDACWNTPIRDEVEK